MKTLFFGTPELAVPYLELLARRTELVAVVSQPDRPMGRGLDIARTPVRAKAEELGLRVLQPEKPSSIVGELRSLRADMALVVAYGRILKPDILSATRLGFLNAHFSLLPKYRGAAPVQWALARGERESGVTLFWLDEGMDTGPVQSARAAVVGPDEDASELLRRLQALGLELADEALVDVAAGRVRREPQRGEPSLAPLIKRADARLSLDRPAAEIHNKTRAFRVWPRTYLELNDRRILVLRTKVAEDATGADGSPGRIVRVDPFGGILVECGGRSLIWFLTVQPEGKKPIRAAEFLNGLRLGAGDFLPGRA